MRAALRELEALRAATAPTSRSADAPSPRAREQAAHAQRLAQLSPYEQAEHYCIECVDLLRRTLTEVDDLQRALAHTSTTTRAATAVTRAGASVVADDDGDEHSRVPREASSERGVLLRELARARLTARRAYDSLQKLHGNVHRQARMARVHASTQQRTRTRHDNNNNGCSRSGHSRDDDDGDDGDDVAAVTASYRALCEHVARTKAWYRDVFHLHVGDDDDGDMTRAMADSETDEQRPLLDAADDDGGGVSLSLPQLRDRDAQRARESAEFVQFMQSVQQRDARMDAALDRIAAGVARLRDNALQMNGELAVQAVLLDTTQQHVEANAQQLRYVNTRLRHALRELRASTLCSYVFCLLCLLCVLCLLLRAATL